MNILIRRVRHSDQPYATVGSWSYPADDRLVILVSDVRNPDEEFLIALHELVEAYLCHKHSVSDESVREFDIAYNKSGRQGEPGDDPSAPYHREHVYATAVERLVAGELGVKWSDHEHAEDNVQEKE